MAHTHAAEKAQRQTKKRTARNRQVKERIKDASKALGKLVAEKKSAEAKPALSKFYKLLDKSAKQHVIHKNKANRLKSAWMQRVNAIK
ncbi:30S ribosomal protein S20 [Candidatus Uhrbacteria bacterium RIFCSPLOWO2_01_FULL_47_24]|uniref:Small ribosomal subunit protein bS20 n=1 Tax=Candidatus Uhrbacteria bacterium RIFCSPLOWO2_01_FULL_47_24 TaxID=1802401 RepID=A0A1F7UUZ6_9BACT|nr:MAG: 30S ribosomal protein S20 [Candidatus Uhrbacteria bacterium RIFCSPHIGHO2_01_FULL_47_11]OGL67515.1 MAG: 30S ribosomal protein S20 [Candidatus Uhrbacteria bacterium RIFCSPHIGHO2_02_FULL_46_47]OGL82110.1 MAG: 30S ribosomal protein S20 [Candidatus Uhrbacteria bacterium RIFCSPLOWO2_01_FULL_47_24]OGL83876.1 MAG: 30S ribosomal protein S20 [Candidatus Uhrbacteria bacterium RIFCSPLOWO2_02_FULL_46_25]OGL91881.1 MAG: 30S ribosomal protein S20 [Candidatus Uhrbacteria bacterium RIFCSPLOWO2_12_FULL_4